MDMGEEEKMKLKKGCLNYLKCRKFFSVEQVNRMCPKCKDFRKHIDGQDHK